MRFISTNGFEKRSVVIKKTALQSTAGVKTVQRQCAMPMEAHVIVGFRDISPTDRLLLEQLPTPYCLAKLRNGVMEGFLAQEAPRLLPVCDVCFCRSRTHTPKCIIIVQARLSNIRVCRSVFTNMYKCIRYIYLFFFYHISHG